MVNEMKLGRSISNWRLKLQAIRSFTMDLRCRSQMRKMKATIEFPFPEDPEELEAASRALELKRAPEEIIERIVPWRWGKPEPFHGRELEGSIVGIQKVFDHITRVLSERDLQATEGNRSGMAYKITEWLRSAPQDPLGQTGRRSGLILANVAWNAIRTCSSDPLILPEITDQERTENYRKRRQPQ